MALRARVAAARPDLALDGVWVERMAAPGGVDLVLGAHRDPAFGPVVLVGVGGIFVETLDDAVLALAPGRSRSTSRRSCARCAPGRCCRARAAPRRSTSARWPARRPRSATCWWRRPAWRRWRSNPARATAAGVVALDARVVMR